MEKISTHITFALPITSAWDLLTDFDLYREWHPGISRIEGTLRPRRRLKVGWNSNQLKLKSNRLRINYFKNLETFSWISSSLIYGLLDLHYIFKFEPLDDEKTRFLQIVEMSGIAVIFFRNFLCRKISNELIEINESLQFYIQNESHRPTKRNIDSTPN